MSSYLILFGAIAFEVLGTMLLPASNNFTKPIPTIVLLLAYGGSFYFLALVSQKLPLNLANTFTAGAGRSLVKYSLGASFVLKMSNGET